MAKPRIGITRSGSAGRIAASYLSYHERVREAGGEPVDLHPSVGRPPADLVAELDGLLLSGGPDILPMYYDEPAAPESGPFDEKRDAVEIALLGHALARDLPVLAICRGQQLVNLARGGKLIQHIAGDGHRAYIEPDPRAGESRWHNVTIEAGSRLAALIGPGSVRTNARHHQAVPEDGLGDGLVITARADDGIVEALEAVDHRWLLTVQWHPERDEVADRFRPLFESFIAAAASLPVVAGSG